MALGRTAAVVVAAMAAVTAGCQSMREPSSEKASSRLHETRMELISARRDVERALSNLEALQNEQRDVRPPFERFRDDVGAIEASFREVRERTDAMQDDAMEHRREWMESTASLSDENLRESARQRNERIRQRYDDIQEMAIETRSTYEPFIQRMRELESYLANDLTPAAVRQADGTVEEAKEDGQRLIQRLDAVIREIEDLALETNTRVEER